MIQEVNLKVDKQRGKSLIDNALIKKVENLPWAIPQGVLGELNTVTDDVVTSVGISKVTNLQTNLTLLAYQLTALGMNDPLRLLDKSYTFDGTVIDTDQWDYSSNGQITISQNDAVTIQNDGSGSGGSKSFTNRNVYVNKAEADWEADVSGAFVVLSQHGFIGSNGYAVFDRSTSSDVIKIRVNVGATKEVDAAFTGNPTYSNYPYMKVAINGNDISFFISDDNTTWVGAPGNPYNYDFGQEALQWFALVNNANPGFSKTLTIDNLKLYGVYDLQDLTSYDLSTVPAAPNAFNVIDYDDWILLSESEQDAGSWAIYNTPDN